jgi:hypothetical protein
MRKLIPPKERGYVPGSWYVTKQTKDQSGQVWRQTVYKLGTVGAKDLDRFLEGNREVMKPFENPIVEVIELEGLQMLTISIKVPDDFLRLRLGSCLRSRSRLT